jgi:hypothetical protein
MKYPEEEPSSRTSWLGYDPILAGPSECGVDV